MSYHVLQQFFKSLLMTVLYTVFVSLLTINILLPPPAVLETQDEIQLMNLSSQMASWYVIIK